MNNFTLPKACAQRIEDTMSFGSEAIEKRALSARLLSQMAGKGVSCTAMSTRLKTQGTTAVLEVEGKLALGDNLDEFRAKWSDALASGVRDLVVNLEKVPMVDSSGIGSLIRCHSAITAVGGRLKLASAGEMVRQSFRIMRLDRVFEFYDNEASAMAAIGASI